VDAHALRQDRVQAGQDTGLAGAHARANHVAHDRDVKGEILTFRAFEKII